MMRPKAPVDGEPQTDFDIDDLMGAFGKLSSNARDMKCAMRSPKSGKRKKIKKQKVHREAKELDIDWSTLNQEVLEELNKVRLNPRSIIPRLKFILDHMRNGKYYAPNQRGPKIGIIYKERDRAIKEAIEHLKKQPKRKALTLSDELSEAASFHVTDQGRTGGTGHVGADGRRPAQRMITSPKESEDDVEMGWKTGCAENIMYGRENGRDMVIALIIDDGIRSRGHRENMFCEDWNIVGIASGPHPKYRTMCVLDFAVGFGQRSPSNSSNQEETEESES